MQVLTQVRGDVRQGALESTTVKLTLTIDGVLYLYGMSKDKKIVHIPFKIKIKGWKGI